MKSFGWRCMVLVGSRPGVCSLMLAPYLTEPAPLCRSSLWLSPSRWRERRPPPVAAPRCCRATHPPPVLRTRTVGANRSLANDAVDRNHFCMPTVDHPPSHGDRHEWVCGPTTSERSDWRRLAYPEMAVYEGEFKPREPQSNPEAERGRSDQTLTTHLVWRGLPLANDVRFITIDQDLGSPPTGVVVAGHAHAIGAC